MFKNTSLDLWLGSRALPPCVLPAAAPADTNCRQQTANDEHAVCKTEHKVSRNLDLPFASTPGDLQRGLGFQYLQDERGKHLPGRRANEDYTAMNGRHG